MDEEGDEVIVDEEEVHFLAELRVFQVQIHLAVIQKPMRSIEVIDHDALVLAYVLQKPTVQLLVLPHLQYVDDLPYVHARALNDLSHRLTVNLKPLPLAYQLHPLGYLVQTRLLELQVVAVVQQGG